MVLFVIRFFVVEIAYKSVVGNAVECVANVSEQLFNAREIPGK